MALNWLTKLFWREATPLGETAQQLLSLLDRSGWERNGTYGLIYDGTPPGLILRLACQLNGSDFYGVLVGSGEFNLFEPHEHKVLYRKAYEVLVDQDRKAKQIQDLDNERQAERYRKVIAGLLL